MISQPNQVLPRYSVGGSLFRPDPNVLLFRRRLGTDPLTGEVDPEAERAAKVEYAEALAASRR